MRFLSRRGPILLVVSVIAGMCAPVASCADKSEVIRKANETYYSLSGNGLTAFRCQVLPDWDATYKDLKMDAVGREQVLPAARRIHFSVAVGPTGAVSISHQSDVAPADEELAKRLRDTTSGLDQVLTGFFQTWSQFMVNSPLPGPVSGYQMEENGNGYRLTADKKDVHAAISMGRDFVIDSMAAKTPDFEGTIHPHFVPHAGGLVLTKYEANYGNGSTSQALSVKVEYQDIEGLPIPRIVTMTMSLPQGEINEPITFDDCRITKKQAKSDSH
jgi:hypothetical protein